MLFLAQSTPDAAALKTFLEVGFYLVGGTTACVALYLMLSGKSGKTEVGPNPLVVQEHVAFVTKEEHLRVVKETKDEFAKQASARKAVYERIEQQGKAVAVLQAETTSQTRQLHALDTKIDSLPDRILRLMERNKNT